MVALVLLLTVVIGVLRFIDGRTADGVGFLLVVPIALYAVRFGARGGAISATIGSGLILALSYLGDAPLTLVGYGTRLAAFFLVGMIVGRFADRDRALASGLLAHQDLSLDLIGTANFEGYFTRVNQAWTDTLGHTREELLARPFIDFVHPDDREATIAESTKLSELGEDALNFQNRYRHRDGWPKPTRERSRCEGSFSSIRRNPTMVSNQYGSSEAEIHALAAFGLRAAMAAPIYGHGAVVGSVVVATTTDRQFSEADAETLAFFAEYAGVAVSTARAADAVRQALTDPLTGLPNRSLFLDRLDHAITRAERTFGEVSVLFIDIDEFKLVNDSLGHLAGDRLLIEVGTRLRKCLRRSDTPARLGGDEFAVLLADEGGAAEPEVLGARVIEAFSEPFQIDGHELRVSASIGLATGRDTPENLLHDADVAMYRQSHATRRSLRVRAGHAGRDRSGPRPPKRAPTRRRGQGDHGRLPADRRPR